MLYVFIPALNCSLAKMSTSVNGTSMDSKICTHVFENPHLGADFVPFMNKTTLFSETHLSICVLSSGPRVAFAGRAKPRAGGEPFFFFWVVEWKSPRRRNEEDDDDVDDDDDDAREVVALGVVAKLLIVNVMGLFFSCERAFTNVDLPSSHSHPKLSFGGHTQKKKENALNV